MRMKTGVQMMFGVWALSAAAILAQTTSVDPAIAMELLRVASESAAVGAVRSNPDLARMYSSSLLEQELAQEAARRGLAERLDVQRAMLNARRQILIQALRADISRGAAAPTDAEVKRRFEQNRPDLKLPEAVKADLYLVDGAAPNSLETVRAAQAAQQIDPARLQKTRFRLVADAAQAWAARNVFPEDVWNEVRKMKKDQVRFFSLPDGNYLLVRFEDYRAERPAALEEVAEDLRNQILREHEQKLWDDYLAAQRKKLGIAE